MFQVERDGYFRCYEFEGTKKKPSQRGGAGPVAFFVALFIVALGTIQLASTFHTYALNLAELNGLKKIRRRRWSRRNASWRTISQDGMTRRMSPPRPGIVWDSSSRRTGDSCRASRSGDRQERAAKKGRHTTNHRKTALPWYKELAYSFKQADRSDPVKADSTKQSQHAGEEDKQDSQQQTGQSQQDGQQPSEDGQE